MWSARAVGSAPFDLVCGSMSLSWVKNFKYVGYWIGPKLGRGVLIKRSMAKIRQRMAALRSFRFRGLSSRALRRALFSSYVLPLFAWLMVIYPLFTEKQRNDLDHLYVSCFETRDALFKMEWATVHLYLSRNISQRPVHWILEQVPSPSGRLNGRRTIVGEIFGQLMARGLASQGNFRGWPEVLEKIRRTRFSLGNHP